MELDRLNFKTESTAAIYPSKMNLMFL